MTKQNLQLTVIILAPFVFCFAMFGFGGGIAVLGLVFGFLWLFGGN